MGIPKRQLPFEKVCVQGSKPVSSPPGAEHRCWGHEAGMAGAAGTPRVPLPSLARPAELELPGELWGLWERAPALHGSPSRSMVVTH